MVYWPGIWTQGKLESDLGDYFEIHTPLSIIHLPTHIHECTELIFMNAFEWGATMPVLSFYQSLLVLFIFTSGIWPLPSASCPSNSVKLTMQRKNRISTPSLTFRRKRKKPEKYRLPFVHQIFSSGWLWARHESSLWEQMDEPPLPQCLLTTSSVFLPPTR